MKKYRDMGAVGALLDEYERAISELKILLDKISPSHLTLELYPGEKDENCRSIQGVLSHVVRAGYCYSIDIRKHFGEALDYKETLQYCSILEYQKELDRMFAYCEQVFLDYPEIKIEEMEHERKIKFSWGQVYDIEQLMEHAIVHILRHRRQIDRFHQSLTN